MGPTQENLKKLVHYDPDTGIMRRIRRLTWRGNLIDCDTEPKSITEYGYRQMHIFGRPHVIHRLAFLYMEGSFPDEDVDHINGDRLDNRWCNLRKVSRRDNLRNTGLRASNKTGKVGVSLCRDTGKYTSYIFIDGVKYHLGVFTDLDLAVQARKDAEIIFGYHPNHGGRSAWRK